MFDQLLKGIKIVVFDIDDTLLLWEHNKRWKDKTLEIKRAFIPDNEWDALNITTDVYKDVQINYAIKGGLLKTINQINKNIYKNSTSAQIKVFALSADTSTYAMHNKINKLTAEFPDDFYRENILYCDTSQQKIIVLNTLCNIYNYKANEILLIDDLQSTLMEADSKGYRVESLQNIMNEWIINTDAGFII